MVFEEFRQKYASHLTEQQLKAVTAPETPVLLLAVPGSGKTTVLVTRLGYLILCRGMEPEHILTITYTVAATGDMKQRFAGLFGSELAERLEFRTINGICAKIISYYANRIGKAPLKLVEDEKRTNGLLTAIYQKTENVYPTESDLKAVRTGISYIKNMLLTQEEIKQLDQKEDFHISEIYRLYCSQMKEQGLMDYDDQMRYALSILRQSPETLAHFRRQYTCICVDEAQDTSRIQHVITAYLAAASRSIFMVGDEDQSIYGFRAAYPQALLDFEKTYPGAQVLLMETNFRSKDEIVRAADRFISSNILRHEKHMVSSDEAQDTESITKINLKIRKDQYAWLQNEARTRQDLVRRGLGDRLPSVAVLYRDNESALPLVDLLERAGLPYRMRSGDWTFFTNRIVTDMKCFLAYALNPRDTDAFGQIYYKMNMFLRKQTAEEVMAESRIRDLPVMELLISHPEEPEYKKKRYREAWSILRKIPKMSALGALQAVVGDLGYGEYLQSKNLSDSKLFTLRTLAARETDPAAFLERLSLLQELVRKPRQETAGDLILSTIHASKGLEYDRVYLLDVIDGIFPESVPSYRTGKGPDGKQRDVKEDPDIIRYEEERRLFYVAMTRAREQLFLFTTFQKSTFCEEISGRSRTGTLIGEGSSEGRTKAKGTSQQEKQRPNMQRTEKLWSEPQRTEKKNAKKKEEPVITGLSFREFCDQFGEGVCVTHTSIGDGVVTAMDEKRITILFTEDPKPHTFLLHILHERGFLKLSD